MNQEEFKEFLEKVEGYFKSEIGGCERCSRLDKTAQGRATVLCGEFHTKLCTTCLREWDNFCDRSMEYKELVHADSYRDATAALIKAGTDERSALITAVSASMKAKTAMHGLAEAWVLRTREK